MPARITILTLYLLLSWPAFGQWQMSGRILTERALSADDSLRICLYKHQPQSNELILQAALLTHDGTYVFDSLASGSYLLRALLNPQGTHGRFYVPTYLTHELFWQDATSITLVNHDVVSPDLILTGMPPRKNGQSTISGKLRYADGNLSGQAVVDASVLLLDDKGSPVQYGFSDSLGQYQFDALLWGDYQLYAEIPGKLAQARWVSLNSQQPDRANLDFEVYRYETHATTSLERPKEAEGKLYPNPVGERLSLQFPERFRAGVSVQLLDTNGRTLILKENIVPAPGMILQMDVQALPPGFYCLKARSGEENWQDWIVKR